MPRQRSTNRHFFQSGVAFCIALIATGCAGPSTAPESQTPQVITTIKIGEGTAAAKLSEQASVERLHQQAGDAFKAKNYTQVLQIMDPLAQRGDAKAQYIIGYMHYYGLGVETDTTIARQWIESSAAQGYDKAISALTLIVDAETNTDQAQSIINKPQQQSVTRTAPRSAEPVIEESVFSKNCE